MSKNYALQATKRERAGKGAARSLRRNNKTPAVIYGDKKEPVKITLDTNQINVEYKKGQMAYTLCDLDVEGNKNLVLARDIQLHPVTDVVEHVDFLRVTDKTKIAVSVPVHFINEEKSPGLEEKGVLNVVRFEVELNCKATNIPDYVEADLTGKEQGDSVRISDVKLPEGVKPVIDDRDFALAAIQAPRRIELETEAVEGEEGAEGAAEGAEGEAAEGASEEKSEDKGEE